MEGKIPDYLTKPFGTYHVPTDSRVAGFDDLDSAKADARARNAKAIELGIVARYAAK